jgi:hypothetical protein
MLHDLVGAPAAIGAGGGEAPATPWDTLRGWRTSGEVA